ncbi:MAG: orotate phosphoribosyltransferase [Planctomycetota bacterium]
MHYDKELLKALLRKHALQFGNFTLASGKQASFYLDCRKVTLHPQGANLIASGLLDLVLEKSHGNPPDSVGGLAIGADPITASMVVHAGLRNLPMLGFMVRKEAKTHGTGKLVEGPVESGMSCVIVEDVITSGGSALKAAESAKDYGLKVLGIYGVIDRLEGGRQAIEQAGYRLETLLTIDDFR